MKLVSCLIAACIAACTSTDAAAASWGFGDASISVQGKGSGADSGFKEKLSRNKMLGQPIVLGPSDTLKILLTVQEGKTPKRSHQVFLQLKEKEDGLGTSYGFSVKDSGKAKVELSHKDIPAQLLRSSHPLSASIMIGSFGSTTPYNSQAFDLTLTFDGNTPPESPEKPLRYGKLPDIYHSFKSDPKSPPKMITLVFTVAVIAAVPMLLVSWISLGANLNHISKALGTSPITHVVFFGSILAMEGIFFMYYTTWNLFQTLPAAAVAGSIIFLSGSRALTEVQGRRLAGLR